MLGQLAQDAAAPDVKLAALVVAFASHIDQDTVDDWAARGLLFAAARPQGLVPGEGAAGLLLADVRLAHTREGTAGVVLEPGVDARRDASADQTKRIDSKVLADLAERACKQANIEVGQLAMVIADTDERANRVLELKGFVSAAMSQLDDASDVACIGAGSGSCGAVPYVAALALAREQAIVRGGPVLCVSNDDPYVRCVALVRPAVLAS
ncbi:hypothetical protein G4G28_00245 [Massilia sp. Dwa41.01b]|uniref:hypothetical protein n=1 Tax=Massilia sp. Dwa41.01b TaxID=2709302 RepID=UPI00160378A0|nr:hypothetical protein [Massilia sp. Dwa41.01b]QNA87281.1 hypothetical protein G4G28_00245 [Massilia sp. Dwa41.01b]